MAQQMVAEGQYLAVFNSTHRVLKAEELLKGKGQSVMLIPAPRTVRADCGLAIRFEDEHRGTVMGLLADAQLLPAFLCQLRNNLFITLEEYTHEDH